MHDIKCTECGKKLMESEVKLEVCMQAPTFNIKCSRSGCKAINYLKIK